MSRSLITDMLYQFCQQSLLYNRGMIVRSVAGSSHVHVRTCTLMSVEQYYSRYEVSREPTKSLSSQKLVML